MDRRRNRLGMVVLLVFTATLAALWGLRWLLPGRVLLPGRPPEPVRGARLVWVADAYARSRAAN